jgi:hypothetical protein
VERQNFIKRSPFFPKLELPGSVTGIIPNFAQGHHDDPNRSWFVFLIFLEGDLGVRHTKSGQYKD